jgi:serine/threonine protein kinase
VKLLLESSPDLRHRLQREAHSYGALQHPNVIDIYDVAETEGGEPFLVMELLSGETLAQPRLNDLVARCLERDRDERLGTASEIVQILESVLAQRTAVTAAPSPPRSTFSSRPDAILQERARAPAARLSTITRTG